MHAVLLSLMVLGLGCGDDDAVAPGSDAGLSTDAGASPADAQLGIDAPIAMDSGPGPDAADPDAGGQDAGRADAGSAPDCSPFFTAAGGSWTGTANTMSAAAGISPNWFTHDATYDITMENSAVTIADSLMGDLTYDFSDATATINCSLTSGIHVVTWARDGRSLNIGYGESADLFTTFGAGFAEGARTGAATFRLTRD